MERTQRAGLHQADAGQKADDGACVGCGVSRVELRCAECGVVAGAGRWRVERVLAQGPSSRVYLARDAEGRRAALKELSFRLAPDVATIHAFEREAEVLARLEHAQLPRFYESFQEGRGVHLRLYLAQELIEGASLLARIQARGPMKSAEAEALAQQLLTVLSFLHQQVPALVHRDVKPANLILRPDGTLVLVDFGSARTLERGHTHGSTLVGTFGYMAPEQLGGTVSPASDVYGAGTTLLHLLSGRAPAELLRDNLELSWEGQVPASWRPLLSWFLARNPQERCATGLEALTRFQQDRPSRVRALRSGPAEPLHVPLRKSDFLAGLSPRWGIILGFGVPLLFGALQVLYALTTHRQRSSDAELAALVRPVDDGVPERERGLFRQLGSAQSDSARVAALDELLYGNPAVAWPASAHDMLRRLLATGSERVRDRAVKVLGRAPVAEAASAEALLSLAQDPRTPAYLRARAATSAGRLLRLLPQDAENAKRADQLLEVALGDPDPDTRIFAGSQLPAIHPLSETALARLREILGGETVDNEAQLLAILFGHMAQLEPTEVEALSLIRSSRRAERHLGIAMFGHLPPSPAALGALSLATEDLEVLLRTDALRVLGQHGPAARPAAGTIRKLLADRNEGVRRQALEALQHIGPLEEPDIEAVAAQWGRETSSSLRSELQRAMDEPWRAKNRKR